ncbi:hypothetical protein [Erythrobacter sp. Dej080120_24]|uniref:hypothetical protein n=1 Tax=Erythrobacter sp. Dej080120_24 TaxID=3024837 RepID=UPI0030C6EB53
MLSIVLGILASLSVLALRFPQWLTLPELRELYPLEYVRLAIDAGIWASLALAGLSMVLRKRKRLGLTGLAMAAIAMALGGGDAPLGPNEGDDIYLGLDWFVLGVLTTAGLFVPLEKAFPLRRGQGAFRAGWLTDTQYFFASHVLAQVMSVAVLAPAVALGAVLAVPSVQALVQSLPCWFSSAWRCWWRISPNMACTAPFTPSRSCGASTRCTTRSRRWTGLPDRASIWST